MNAPPQRIGWLQSLARQWRMIMLSIISVAMGYVVWDRPIPPTWVYTPPTGSVGLIGLTRDGRVVAMDYPTDDAAQDLFRILDIKTGRVLSEFAIPGHESIKFEGLKPRFHSGVISGDGQVAVVYAASWGIVLFVNLQNGEFVHPPHLGGHWAQECSPDGRYVVLNVSNEDEHGNSTGSSERLFDLKTGQLSWTCEQDTRFSPDSQLFLCYERDDEQRRVTIRSVRDNSTILSDSVPSIPGGENAEFHNWSGTRLYVNYSFDVPGSPVPERRCWSYATTGTRLSDQKREPLIGGYLVNPRCLVFRSFRGEERLHFPPEKGSLLDRIGNLLGEWGILFRNWRSEHSWQPLSLVDAEPLGVRVGGLSHDFRVSPQRDWLVDDGDQLRAWKLPAYHNLARWCYVCLTAAAPWGLLWILRRQTKVSKAKPSGLGHEAS
jgi:hypothetical protein